MSTQPYNPQPNGAPLSRPSKFSVGAVPEIVAIASIPGEMATSEFGPSEVRFRLVDGRTWYVPQVVADEINVRLAPRQQFEVVRFGRAKHELRITPLPAHLGRPDSPPQHVPTPPERSYDATYTQEAPRAAAQPAASPNTARMMACFLVALDAVNEAQSYAKAKGIGITFTSDNVTSAALSCYINSCKEGR